MLILDSRENGMKSELSMHDVEVTEMTLNSADLRFSGNGEDGECLVGCERKKLSDLINCMQDRRLAGRQLRELWQEHDYVFLFVEGIWRPGPGGIIEELRGREFRPFFNQRDRRAVNYRQVIAYLTSLALKSRGPNGEPVRVVRTQSARQTAAEYVALYHWFTDKEWREHHSHEQIYTNEAKRGNGRRAGTVFENITTVWKMAAQLPGVDRKAEMVAKHFGTVRAMANAEVEEWMKIRSEEKTKAGRAKPGFGKTTAAAIIRAMTEEGA